MKVGLFSSRETPNNGLVSLIKQIADERDCKIDNSFVESSIDDEKKKPGQALNKIKSILTKNDVFIVDSTHYSTGLGLIIGRILEQNVPLLVLFLKQGKEKNSSVLKAHTNSKKVFYFEVDNLEDAQIKLQSFFDQAKDMLDQKFLFSFSAKMSKYLQWSSENENRPMVDIIRELIDNRMSNDKQWIDFLNEDVHKPTKK